MAAADSPLFRFQIWRAALPPALRLLLTVNLVTYLAFVLLALVAAFGAPTMVVLEYLWLSADPATVLTRPWTPLTYGFVNAFGGFFGLISFVFGFYWLQWMGRDYEETYGSGNLFALYLLGGLAGAALALALGAVGLVPRGVYFGIWTPVTAILCAVGTLTPNRGIGLFLLGVVPMKWIAVGFVVLSFVFSQDMTVLGAALGGVLFARAQRAGMSPGAWASPFFGRRGGRSAGTAFRNPFARSEPATKTAGRATSRSASPRRGGAASPTLSVDQILDKILEKGYDSLTPEERDALDRASRD